MRARIALLILVAAALASRGDVPRATPQTATPNAQVTVVDATVVPGIDAPAAQLLTRVEPRWIRATVHVTDILRPTFGSYGPGDPASVRVTAMFSAFSHLAGETVPVRFDPTTTTVTCSVDAPAPPVTLAYRDGRYSAIVPRGRAFRDALPNYYMVEVRVGETVYGVARVPVVDALSISAPREGERFFPDVTVPTSFMTASWRVLWVDADPHFRFQHENSAVLTEREASGRLRLVGQITAPGDHTLDPQTLGLTPMVLPYPTPLNNGTVHVITRYRSTDDTIGPTEFLLDEWTSSAGAERGIVWRPETTSGTNATSAASIDHIMLGFRSLEEGMNAFEKATGVKPLPGGRHPHMGTENALVSLGEGAYLEIIAPQPDAKSNPMVDGLRGLASLAVIGWALGVADVDDAVARLANAGLLATKPQPGSRVTPEGTTLEWVTFGLEKQPDTAPFFIRWSESTKHPSRTSPGGCTMAALEIDDPRGEELTRMLKALGANAAVRVEAKAKMRLSLRCGEREATFASP
jgi:hypothetical protein